MDKAKEQAYRVVLSAGLLHLKWDLACWHGGFAWRKPKRALQQIRAACRAAARSFAFHNLAIFSANNFAEFSEDVFWEGVQKFHGDYPDAICTYRETFDDYVQGKEVVITRPA